MKYYTITSSVTIMKWKKKERGWEGDRERERDAERGKEIKRESERHRAKKNQVDFYNTSGCTFYQIR